MINSIIPQAGGTATVAPRAYFFCCARKSRQKDALGDAPYCALTRAILFDALFGRKIVRLPIAYGSDQCTTCSYRQTASISVLLISGILGQSHSCTALCRGRWRAQPSATKERYGCGLSLAGAHRSVGNKRIRRRFPSKRCTLRGPMWASAPANMYNRT